MFNRYTKLLANSIPDWLTMKSLFLIYFYSTRRTVNLKELSLIEQKENEKVTDYIRR